jgi:hypothetical protein
LPIHVHWGLNRITVDLVGRRAAPSQELELGNIVLAG